ncbi:MAG: O-antigen ligase family protein [Bacteroidota bacterium]|nr:O-antigen ligase family protein [Bacteroidota bacterium]
MQLASIKVRLDEIETVKFDRLFKSQSKVLMIVLVHFVLGLITSFTPFICLLGGVVIPAIALIEIVKVQDRNKLAGFVALYLGTFDLLLRGNNVALPWEYSKYISSLFFAIGLFYQSKHVKFNFKPIFYLVLLLPSILVLNFTLPFSEIKNSISFNLSGHLCLALSIAYFLSIRIPLQSIKSFLLAITLPMIASVGSIVTKIGSLSSITFNMQSNLQASGGFGPNQTAVLLGFGFIVIIIGIVINQNIFKNTNLNITLAMIFLGFGLFTFSRGGVAVAILDLLGLAGLGFLLKVNPKSIKRILSLIFYISILLVIVFVIIKVITNNSLSNRYLKTIDKKAVTGAQYDTKSDVDLSGRDKLVEIEYQIFLDNPILGIGPGGATYHFKKVIGYSLPSHTEFSRLLSEHGLYGVGSLLFLISIVYNKYKRSSKYSKLLIFGFAFFTVASMLHAAMRIAVISYAIGLGLINIIEDEPNPLESKIE